MSISELEASMDRLENAICASKIPSSLKQLLTAFSRNLAKEALDAMQERDRVAMVLRGAMEKPSAN